MTNTAINTNVLGAFVAAFIIISLIGSLSVNAAPLDKVTICHATSSETNPFVTIHVSANAINGHFENNGTTKAGHEGDLLFQGEINCPGDNGGGGGGGDNENSTSTPISGTLTGTVQAPASTSTATSTGGSLTGTVATTSGSGALTGTVTAPSGGSTLTGSVTSGGGGSTPGVPNTGGGGGGSSPSVIDYCSNIGDVQTSIPAGYGVQNGICTLLSNGNPGGVGGGNGEVLGEQTPGVPNTGAGGNAAQNLLVLVATSLAAAASGMILRRSYFI